MNDTTEPAGLDASSLESEAELVERLRQRDEAAFELVVRRYTRRLHAVARRFLHSEEDCADAVQDAFLQAFRSITSFQGKARLSTWLHRIVVNVCLNRLRARSRGGIIPLDDLLPQSNEPVACREPSVLESADSGLCAAETREQVQSCMDRLPEAYRTILRLRDLEELDTDQTARMIGTTHGVVKTRLHRARRALRELLEPVL
jgi:RNA polymerase sigma-70 factor (ECF subfamily)